MTTADAGRSPIRLNALPDAWRVVVYTAWTGAYEDRLRPVLPQLRSENTHFICFTDDPQLVVDGWEMAHVSLTGLAPVHMARQLKILAEATLGDLVHASIWLDASMQLQVEPRDLLAQWTTPEAPVAMFPHPERRYVEEEAAEILRLNLADEDCVTEQLAHFERMGFVRSEQPPLPTTGVILRRHTDLVEDVNRRWWNEYILGAHSRDQLSVQFALWQAGCPLRLLPGTYRDNPFVEWRSAAAGARAEARRQARRAERPQAAGRITGPRARRASDRGDGVISCNPQPPKGRR